MYVSGGLSGIQQELLGTRLLHETCFDVKYTYLVASTKKGDTKTLQGGPLGLIGLLFSGGLQKIGQQFERDNKILEELGDQADQWIGNCEHDDIPTFLPASIDGFDKSLKLLVAQKPADFLDLTVERDALVRIQVHSSNSRNQVKVFIYQSAAD